MDNQAPINASDLLQGMLDAGMSPKTIRREFAQLGKRFSYSTPRHQGARERARRQVQHRLCTNDCGGVRTGDSLLCEGCLVKKWGGA